MWRDEQAEEPGEWCQEVGGKGSPSVDGGYHRGQVVLEGCRLHQVSCLRQKEPSALLVWGERGVREGDAALPGLSQLDSALPQVILSVSFLCTNRIWELSYLCAVMTAHPRVFQAWLLGCLKAWKTANEN